MLKTGISQYSKNFRKWVTFFRKELKNISITLYNEGGVLITGSNQEPGTPVDGGIYQKVREGFKKIWQSGKGSPIEHQILNLNTQKDMASL